MANAALGTSNSGSQDPCALEDKGREQCCWSWEEGLLDNKGCN